MLNGITLELLWRRLISIVDEAAVSLVRTSFSTIVRESNDFACVITDAEGRSIAQATSSIPSFIGTVPRTIRHFLEVFPPEHLSEGDILITNDCWLGTGHLPDITVAKPIYLDGRLVAFAGSVAHSPDIGGRMRSADAREVFEEGLQIPPMKVMERGRINAALEQILRKNVRVPDQVMGDLYAQFTGLALMERQVVTLMRERNLPSLEELSRELRGRSETAMRKAISALPDGTYRSEAVSDGIDDPIRLKLALTVAGDRITADFAGSHAQVPRSINVCLAYTTAYTSYGIKAVLCPDVPNNDGALAPLHITAPLGSILNSEPPAAGGARALIGHFLPAMVMLALSEIAPERTIAGAGHVHAPERRRPHLRKPVLPERRLRRQCARRRHQRAVLAEQYFVDAGRGDRAAGAAESALPQIAFDGGCQRRVSRRRGAGDAAGKSQSHACGCLVPGRANPARGGGSRNPEGTVRRDRRDSR